MRSRTKTEVLATVVTQRATTSGLCSRISCSGVVTAYTNNTVRESVTYDTEVRTSSMLDVVGSFRKRKQANFVRHQVSSYVVEPASAGYVHTGTSSSLGHTIYPAGPYAQSLWYARSVPNVANKLGTYLKPFPYYTISWPYVDDRVQVQRLYDRARKNVVEGLVALVESPELPGSIRSLATYQQKLGSGWETMRRTAASLRRLSKDAANKYLAYTFGIAPLVADLEKAQSFLKKIESDYARYAAGSVRRVSSTFQGTATPPDYDEYNEGITRYPFQGRVTEVPTVRYVLTYREKQPYNTELFKKVSYLINRFGAGGPVSFAWELVPFSFVVDWFIDTSSILYSLDEVLQTDRIETLSLTKSRKMQAETDAFIEVGSGCTPSITVKSEKIGQLAYSWYERVPLGRSTYVDWSDRFGKKQALSLLALLRSFIK